MKNLLKVFGISALVFSSVAFSAPQVVLTSKHSQVSLLRNGYMIQVTGPVAVELQALSNQVFGSTEVSRNGCLVRDAEADDVQSCAFPLISCSSLDKCAMTVVDMNFADSVRNAKLGGSGLNLVLNRRGEMPLLRQNGHYFKNLVTPPVNPNGGEGSGSEPLVAFDILADGSRQKIII